MIPNVFVSSTIEDLHFLRDAIRDTVHELGYNPVMSEYGEIGFLGEVSVEVACLNAMRDCQIAVLVLGKRYGHLAANGMSITHNEFLAARERQVPVIALVDREVLAYERIFEANKGRQPELQFPGMDAPANTFGLLADIRRSPVNNGILPVGNATDARFYLKTQLAHLFAEFLRGYFRPEGADIKEILAEIKTLRHQIEERVAPAEARKFMKAVRLLLEDKYRNYAKFVENLGVTIEDAVPALLKSSTFQEFLASITGKSPELVGIVTSDHITEYAETHKNEFRWHGIAQVRTEGREYSVQFYGQSRDGHVVWNPGALQFFEIQHRLLVESASK